MKTITDLIIELREEFMVREKLNEYREINNGHCMDFADELEALVEEELNENGEIISNDDFMVRDDEDTWCGDYEDVWDKKALEIYGSPLPLGITSEELNFKIRGYHCWFYYKGKHYDADTPEGVENIFDMKFFREHLENEDSEWFI